jgi:hypothetical protein
MDRNRGNQERMVALERRDNMRRFQTLRSLVLALAMGVIFGLGLLGYNHGNDRGKSPCAGPIPCLTEDLLPLYHVVSGS